MERDRFELDTGSSSVESHVRGFRRLNGDVSGAGLVGALLGAIVGLVLGFFTAVSLVPVGAIAMWTGLVVGGTAGVVAARRRRQLIQNAAREGA
jgi:hypothetical protein